MNPESIVGPSWARIIGDEFKKPYMKRVSKIVQFHRARYNVFPEPQNVFRAFKLTPFDKVKVVIIGQDPYPTKGHADGLAFSFNEGTPQNMHKTPKSLQNIFTEIEDDLGFDLYHDTDLSRWARQGVLLLNTYLTVVEGRPGSHSEIGWLKFTRTVVHKLNQKDNQLVYLLWGKHAQSFIPLIRRHHEYLTAPHPSPLSAYRGFFGSRPFSNCNKILELSGQEPIQWTQKATATTN